MSKNENGGPDETYAELKAQLAAALKERDEEREKKLLAHDKLDRAEDERDAAIARAEKAEAERDQHKHWHECFDDDARRLLKEKLAAIARAERAEAERDEAIENRNIAEAIVAAHGDGGAFVDLRDQRDEAEALLARIRAWRFYDPPDVGRGLWQDMDALLEKRGKL